MSDLIWEDPPASIRAGRGASEAVTARIADLKAHPGRWARWPTKTNPAQMKKTHGVEAVTRKIDGKPVTFVRWPAPAVVAVPDPDPHPETPKPTGPSGPVVCCDECDFEVPARDVPQMLRHTMKAHKRPARNSERTPVTGGAA